MPFFLKLSNCFVEAFSPSLPPSSSLSFYVCLPNLKVNEQRKRTVVITQGHLPTIIYYDGKVGFRLCPNPVCLSEQIGIPVPQTHTSILRHKYTEIYLYTHTKIYLYTYTHIYIYMDLPLPIV